MKKNILEKEIEKKREKEKAKAAANLGELQFTIDELKEENNDLKRSSHQKQGDLERVTSENLTLENKLKQLTTEKEALQEKLTEAEKFLASKQGRPSDRIEKELAETNLKYAQATSDLDDKESEIEDLKEQLLQEKLKNQRLTKINKNSSRKKNKN